MELSDLQNRAKEIKELYDRKNEHDGNKKWTASDYTAGFVGDVGDLSKLVMAKQGLRNSENVDEKLAHELADCLWSILVIAKELDIDLEQSFEQTMSELEAKLKHEH